jgi:hypothetical protein
MRVRRKVLIIILLGTAALAILAVAKRYELTRWYLQGHQRVRDEVILRILETTRPVIESNFKMTALERILSAVVGHRNEKERQTDALKDVRAFSQSGFDHLRLKFEDVHRLKALSGFALEGSDFSLGWNDGKKDEILAAFEVDFWKMKIGRVRVNESCGFFRELRTYVEKRAGQN